VDELLLQLLDAAKKDEDEEDELDPKPSSRSSRKTAG
jgi:hypothetical protein